MNWETIAAISEAVGAMAVVVSLIYLAVQIRQNTKAIRGTTIDAITAHQQEELRWSSEMPEVFRKALEEPEALTYEESWRLSEWMTASIHRTPERVSPVSGKDFWTKKSGSRSKTSFDC